MQKSIAQRFLCTLTAKAILLFSEQMERTKSAVWSPTLLRHSFTFPVSPTAYIAQSSTRPPLSPQHISLCPCFPAIALYALSISTMASCSSLVNLSIRLAVDFRIKKALAERLPVIRRKTPITESRGLNFISTDSLFFATDRFRSRQDCGFSSHL
jgi:hypothetical protein